MPVPMAAMIVIMVVVIVVIVVVVAHAAVWRSPAPAFHPFDEGGGDLR